MKKLKEIVEVLSQIVPLVVGGQDGGPGSGQKGHTTAQQNATAQASKASGLENRRKALTGHKNASVAYQEAKAAHEKANLARREAKKSGNAQAHASAQVEFENTKRALGNATAKKTAATEKKNEHLRPATKENDDWEQASINENNRVKAQKEKERQDDAAHRAIENKKTEQMNTYFKRNGA